MRFALASLVSLALATVGHARAWRKTRDIVGNQFYDHFRFDNIPDPTNGRVDYVDKNTAIANNLTYGGGNTFILRADSTNKVASGERGRKSVRLVSTESFRHHVAIFDVRHMPQGCATWPAIWETGLDDWPNQGELDILEGVNDVPPNAISVHTSIGCTVSDHRDQTGTVQGTDCGTHSDNDPGCAVMDPNQNSYGPSFNRNGGGWYAIERTDSFIKAWFWPRNVNPPGDVKNGNDQINTDSWGTPLALFPNSATCDFDKKFGDNSIIINLTLCGDYAGGSWGDSGCPGSCIDLVDNNPGAFAQAYFDIASARIYQ